MRRTSLRGSLEVPRSGIPGYPEPGLRSFGDIDLLVRRQDYDHPLALLCAHGARRRSPEPRRGFYRRCGKGVCLETSHDLEIDLHRTFVAGPFGLAIDTDALFGTGSNFSLGGHVFEGLDPAAQFLDASFQAALGDVQPRVVALRDIAQMMLDSALDSARVQELCRKWRCGIVVQRAIQLADDAFTLDAMPEVMRWTPSYEATSFERRALQAYVGADRSYARQTVAGLHALRGFRAKTTYAATLRVPTRAYMRVRDGSYLRRAGRAFRVLRDDRAGRRQHASRP
jgi:Uncharacterised nucleotidyltransferase